MKLSENPELLEAVAQFKVTDTPHYTQRLGTKLARDLLTAIEPYVEERVQDAEAKAFKLQGRADSAERWAKEAEQANQRADDAERKLAAAEPFTREEPAEIRNCIKRLRNMDSLVFHEVADTMLEFDAWLCFRPEFVEVLTAFRSAFGTDSPPLADSQEEPCEEPELRTGMCSECGKLPAPDQHLPGCPFYVASPDCTRPQAEEEAHLWTEDELRENVARLKAAQRPQAEIPLADFEAAQQDPKVKEFLEEAREAVKRPEVEELGEFRKALEMIATGRGSGATTEENLDLCRQIAEEALERVLGLRP